MGAVAVDVVPRFRGARHPSQQLRRTTVPFHELPTGNEGFLTVGAAPIAWGGASDGQHSATATDPARCGRLCGRWIREWWWGRCAEESRRDDGSGYDTFTLPVTVRASPVRSANRTWRLLRFPLFPLGSTTQPNTARRCTDCAAVVQVAVSP